MDDDWEEEDWDETLRKDEERRAQSKGLLEAYENKEIEEVVWTEEELNRQRALASERGGEEGLSQQIIEEREAKRALKKKDMT